MLELTDGELKRKQSEAARWLLFLHTPLCGTCKVAGRMLEAIEQACPELEIYRANLNVFPQLAAEWRIESVPCLAVLSGNACVDTLRAFHSVAHTAWFLSRHGAISAT